MMFQVDELLYTLSAVEYNGGGRRVFFFHMELKQLIFLKQNYLVTVEHLLMKKNHFVCL